MPDLVVIARNPYSKRELFAFERLILAANNPNPQVRLAGVAALAAFFREHGQAKCDLMMEALDKKHGTAKQ